MRTNPLLQLGNIPVSIDVLTTCFADFSSPHEKIRALEKDGQLVRLKRGMYVVSNEVSGKDIDMRLCANHIYGPSYVSLQWALRWYGLIPERVQQMTSVTTKRSRTFENAFGMFSYRQVPVPYFSVGVRTVEDNGIACLMATPEKALCDTILWNRYVPAQSVVGLSQYLEEDLRFDMDALQDMDVAIVETCAGLGRKEGILRNLIKLMKQ